jgi:hypothetical protein
VFRLYKSAAAVIIRQGIWLSVFIIYRLVRVMGRTSINLY